MTRGHQLWCNEDSKYARKIVSRFQVSTHLCIINSDCLTYAARVHTRRHETRSGKDITGLSRMTRRTRSQTGIIRRNAFGMYVHVRVRVQKQVRFIYRVKIGEILPREILSVGCNYFLMDIDLCYNPCRRERKSHYSL